MGGRRMGGRSRQRHAKVICYLFMSLRKEASFTPGLLHAGWRPCKDGHWQWKGYTDMQPPFLKKRVSGRKMSWVFGLICFLEVKSWDRMKGSITFYFPKGSPSWLHDCPWPVMEKRGRHSTNVRDWGWKGPGYCFSLKPGGQREKYPQIIYLSDSHV